MLSIEIGDFKILKINAYILLNSNPILKIPLLAGEKLLKDSGGYVVPIGKKTVAGVSETSNFEHK